MYTIYADSASEFFIEGCRSIVATGREVAPRGLPTRELMSAHLQLSDPRDRLVQADPARVLNPAFAAAEAIWILSGSDDPWIFEFNDRLWRFADHGRLQGAYGPRMRRWRGCDQLEQVRRVLENDGDSRQAVIQIFDPERDLCGFRDVPCTLGYRFYIREGRLVMVTSMRSQDAWLGLPYDLVTTTILQELMAGWLGVEIGDYHHVVDSLHLYEQHRGLTEELPHRARAGAGVMAPLQVPFAEFDAVLAQVRAGETVGHPGWDDMASVLASYRLWKRGDRDDARAVLGEGVQPLTAALRRWYELLITDPDAVAPAPTAPGRVA